jgi:hypothetical protein
LTSTIVCGAPLEDHSTALGFHLLDLRVLRRCGCSGQQLARKLDAERRHSAWVAHAHSRGRRFGRARTSAPTHQASARCRLIRNNRRALERLIEAIAIDYIETHVGSYKALPRDMQSILQHWKDEYDSADTARKRVDDEPGFLLRIARLTSKSLRETRAANLDILNELEPTLVVAIDDLIRDIENISFFYHLFRQPEEDDLRNQSGHFRSLVEEIQSFTAVYVQIPGATTELTESSRQLLDKVQTDIQSLESD